MGRGFGGERMGMEEALQGKGEGGDGQTGGREWVGYSPCGLGLRLPPRLGVHGRITPLPPSLDKPSPLPFRRGCSNPEIEGGGAEGESPLSPCWRSRRWGVGGTR